MTLEYRQINGRKIALANADHLFIRETQDALDLMADASYQGADRIVLFECQLAPEFFDLKSGMAGEILQKFSTYRVRLAVVGNFSNVQSKSLRDFIRESNRYGHVNFVGSEEEALEKLTMGHTNQS
jgi:hypothetical protein